jgi:hypothetical protein
MQVKYVLFGFLLFANTTIGCEAGQLKTQKLYFLRDDSAKQWCGYTNQTVENAEFGRMHSVLDGEVDYTNGQVSRIVFTLNSVSGDWDVQDEFIVDKDERFNTVRRSIVNLTHGVEEVQQFIVQDGKAIRQSTTTRALQTGEPAPALTDDYGAVITTVTAFPFWTFVKERHQQILSEGKLCVADKR